jgi:hypothetical protein
MWCTMLGKRWCTMLGERWSGRTFEIDVGRGGEGTGPLPWPIHPLCPSARPNGRCVTPRRDIPEDNAQLHAV